MHNQHRILRVLQLIAILQKEPAKSIRNLSLLIESTERTVYRYLDLIKLLGFDLQKDTFNKYFIANSAHETAVSFTAQEASLLTTLLQTSAKKSKLKDGILKKIYLNNEMVISSNSLLKANLGKLVEGISTAIQNQKQIILKKYHSANSNTITDRLVEPIAFTDNYTALAAYEVESGQNKYFNIERIGDIKITTKAMAYKQYHSYNTPDAFGFGQTTHAFKVQLRLNLRAYLILKEEYPMVTPFIKLVTKKTNTYLLTINVNDFKPITRFVLGLIDDVEVLGSDEFIHHLQNIAYKLLPKQNNL